MLMFVSHLTSPRFNGALRVAAVDIRGEKHLFPLCCIVLMITIYLCGKGLYWGEIFIIFLIVDGYLMKFIMNMQSKSKCLEFLFLFYIHKSIDRGLIESLGPFAAFVQHRL